jgi:hypothetical protein
MFGGLNVKLVACIVGLIGSFLFGAYVNGLRLEKKHASELFALAEKSKAIQNTIETSYVLERNKKDEQIKDLNNRLNAALIGLRSRPARESSTTTGPSLVIQGCDGTKLFREDAEFLTREAARADEIRIAYIELYNDYVNIRKALGQ